MRSVEERTTAVTARVQALSLQRERWKMAGLSAMSTLLLAALVVVIGKFSGGGHTMLAESMTGSTLLSESAGGYVLVAVLSFAAAVAVTVLCFRWRKRQENKKREEISRQSKEETA